MREIHALGIYWSKILFQSGASCNCSLARPGQTPCYELQILNAPDAAQSECDAKPEGTNNNCDEPKNVHMLIKETRM
jgi:hypothetical protein